MRQKGRALDRRYRAGMQVWENFQDRTPSCASLVVLCSTCVCRQSDPISSALSHCRFVVQKPAAAACFRGRKWHKTPSSIFIRRQSAAFGAFLWGAPLALNEQPQPTADIEQHKISKLDFILLQTESTLHRRSLPSPLPAFSLLCAPLGLLCLSVRCFARPPVASVPTLAPSLRLWLLLLPLLLTCLPSSLHPPPPPTPIHSN